MNSATGTRTRVARVRAEYPDQLDYSGIWTPHRNRYQLHYMSDISQPEPSCAIFSQ